MQFYDELPKPTGTIRDEPVDWAKVKQEMIANEGKWGLLAANVAVSVPTQMRKGRNKHFRGEELEHFEFTTRKPENPEVPYPPKRTDLWGRYTK